MTTNAQKRASSKYDKKNTKAVMLKLNSKTDADILAFFEKLENRQGYIKGLIRRDIRGYTDVLSIDAISMLVIPVAKRFGIEKIELFGSYARGEATADSDVDLMIEGGTHRSLYDYVDLTDAFREALGKPVDIVSGRKVMGDDSRQGRRFRKNFEKDRLVIYEETTRA